jgi:hypothetical protein
MLGSSSAILAIVLALFANAGPKRPERSCNAPVFRDFTQARAQSLSDHRLIVVFFYDGSDFSATESAAVRRLRAYPAFCSCFAFVELDVSNETTLGLVRLLGIKIAPAVSVLKATQQTLHEITHFEGLYSFEELRNTIVLDACDEFNSGRISLNQTIVSALNCRSSHAAIQASGITARLRW